MADAPPARSRLTVLAGPTAVGKGTVAAEVRRTHPGGVDLGLGDDRSPPPGEIDGIHYRFVDDAEFDRLVAEGTAAGVGRRPPRSPVRNAARAPVEEALAAGRPALLEIDLQGARQVRERMPEALLVFLKPPSWEELVRRLVGRGTEDPEERERRLETARAELAAESEFDVTVVNAEVHDAAEELIALMTGASAGSAS